MIFMMNLLLELMLYKSYLIEQNIKNFNKNINLFFGENLGLINHFKKEIKKDNPESELITFNQEEILRNNLIFFNEIKNISLFKKKKIYFINLVDDKLLEVIKNVISEIDDQKLFLFADLLDKKSKIRNYFEKSELCGSIICYQDNEVGIKKIILKKLNGFQGLSTNNINMITENCNLDRMKLENELEKIRSFFHNKILESKDLEILLNVKTNENFNILNDEALNGNKIETNKLLSNTVIDEDKNIYYLMLINQKLNKLNNVLIKSKSKNLANIIDTIKPPIFWKDKPNLIKQAKIWNQDKIKYMLNKTFHLEIKMKSSSALNQNILIRKLILDICFLANAS